jgi:hypothetical protein
MIEWRMRTEDVIRIRFAYSPLMELVLSLMALRARSSTICTSPSASRETASPCWIRSDGVVI